MQESQLKVFMEQLSALTNCHASSAANPEHRILRINYVPSSWNDVLMVAALSLQSFHNLGFRPEMLPTSDYLDNRNPFDDTPDPDSEGAEATQAVNRISAWARLASRASPRCFGGHFDSLAGRRVGGHGRIAQTLTNRHFGLQRRRSGRQKWRLESLVDAHQLGAEFDEFGQRKW
ncbi:hypothetical protein DAPPUDRAFT_108792 [Daphnia pulex]|uniref:Uncharacterized protein n=1 Tax=Daphnia pulex TaxID=6669 RepID=E9H1F2_DAPPU|nr:hypothetical protein DAPPUDRAFT_108792 [Daphnia pulex]|eukprot:EFX74509.1 hypothetical protein DAPPUDRAFT_108792 [Daphnia pulex]